MLGLSPTQEMIFARLQRGEQRIIDLTYALWKGGGPEGGKANNAIHNHVCLLNKRLRPHGYEVRCRRNRYEANATSYHLVQLPPDARPAHKFCDRDGIYVE